MAVYEEGLGARGSPLASQFDRLKTCRSGPVVVSGGAGVARAGVQFRPGGAGVQAAVIVRAPRGSGP